MKSSSLTFNGAHPTAINPEILASNELATDLRRLLNPHDLAAERMETFIRITDLNQLENFMDTIGNTDEVMGSLINQGDIFVSPSTVLEKPVYSVAPLIGLSILAESGKPGEEVDISGLAKHSPELIQTFFLRQKDKAQRLLKNALGLLKETTTITKTQWQYARQFAENHLPRLDFEFAGSEAKPELLAVKKSNLA